MDQEFFIALAINAITALVIAIVALWFSSWVKTRIVKLSERNARFDRTLAHFLGSVARYAILALAVVFILGRFGIQTTSLAAIIGAAGLAIGLALQGSLSNLAAGVLLVALPTGIVAAAFSDAMQRRREAMARALEDMEGSIPE